MRSRTWPWAGLAIGVAAVTLGAVQPSRATVVDRVMRLTRASAWTLTSSVRLAFPTYHPQGMVKVGDTLYISSVEVRVPTRRIAGSGDGVDRDTGEGVGHIFKATLSGRLLEHVTVGEGSAYHPGGLDFDGTHLWVAVAEYRPNSRSIVYRLDPATMKAAEVFRFADHLGALVHDTDAQTLHGVSWGSRWLYRWPLDAAGRVSGGAAAETPRIANPSHYVDYQDCKYAGAGRMLCSGVAELGPDANGRSLQLGGLDLVDLRSGRPLHQLPIALWTADGLSMTRNPVFLEPTATGLRGYFLPEDDSSTLYVYDVEERRR